MLLAAAHLAAAAPGPQAQRAFPFPKAVVYQALLKAVPAAGFRIKARDPRHASVMPDSGPSALASEPGLSLVVVEAGPGRSLLKAMPGDHARAAAPWGQVLFERVADQLAVELRDAPKR